MTSYTFDQLLDFTRTSSATFVGSDGLIQNTAASRNLLTFTQEFDNAAWAKVTSATVTANTTIAPDGTSTADTLDLPLNLSRVERVVSGLTTASYTFSVYVKGTSGQTVNVELGSATQTVTLNGDWQRISVTNSGSTSYAPTIIRRTTTATSIFLWGAQLEAASAATTYTRNNGGVFPPRFDYDPVTLAAKGILIEEQRTNLLTYSEQFDNAAWADAAPTSTVTVAANNTTAPDGTSAADKLTAATGGTNAMARQAKTLVASTAYTGSIFVKASTSTQSRLLLRDTTAGTNFADATLTWTAGVPTVAGGSVGTWAIIPFGNGWYRVTGTGTSGATASPLVTFSIFPDTAAGTNAIFIYGAQLEAGAFATSYIPTVASQVTRSADQCAIVAPMFAPWYNQTEGTLVFEGSTFKPTTVSASGIGVEANDGTLNNRNVIQYQNNNATGQTTAAGSVISAIGQVYTASATDKLAYAYKINDFAFARNGALVGTDTAGGVPVVDRLALGNFQGQAFLNGNIRAIRYYPTRLSNTQLQALTTL